MTDVKMTAKVVDVFLTAPLCPGCLANILIDSLRAPNVSYNTIKQSRGKARSVCDSSLVERCHQAPEKRRCRLKKG